MRHHLKIAQLILFYLWGFFVLFLQAIAATLIFVWLLQFGALAFDETHPWADVCVHLILSNYLLMLFPGQRLWTLRLTGPGGRIYTSVGDQEIHEEA